MEKWSDYKYTVVFSRKNGCVDRVEKYIYVEGRGDGSEKFGLHFLFIWEFLYLIPNMLETIIACG